MMKFIKGYGKMKKTSRFIKIMVVALALIFIFLKWDDEIRLTITKYNPFADADHTYVSPYIFVLDRDTENIVFEKNASSKAYPASLTKIMTTIVALENIDDLSTITPVDIDTYQKMVAQNASMAGFVGKEEVTYRDLLYGTMLSSGGEAANSLAVHVAGSTELFVQMMNEKAIELGLASTQFTNPEGLHDDKQYTTAQDMAKLLNYALEDGDFRAIFTKETFVTTATADHPDGILLRSTVLSQVNDEEQKNFKIMGGKSGTTYESGQCWATLGLVEEEEYLVIVMGAPFEDFSHLDQAQIEDTIKIYKNIEKNNYSF